RPLLGRVDAVAFQLGARGRLAGAELDAAVGDQVEGRDARGHLGGVIVLRRHQHDAVPEANALGALRAGAEEHLGCGGVRIFLEEVVLDLPGVVDAQAVGELNLIERFLVQAQLGAVVPWPRQLVLVEDPEFHGDSFPGRESTLARRESTPSASGRRLSPANCRLAYLNSTVASSDR